MARDMNRRDFLRCVGTGAAVLSLPGLAAGCRGPGSVVRGDVEVAGAHTTYFDQFGVDAGLLSRVIGRSLESGGTFAEVFLQHSIDHWLILEDGQVNRAYSQVDLGAGIRVLQEDTTGYAYSEDLSPEALLATAAAAASAACSSTRSTPKALAVVSAPNRYPIEVAWSDIGLDAKLPLVQRTDALARARDSKIIKVTAGLQDTTSRILVANSDGLLIEDDQPMAVIFASCVARQGDRTETNSQSYASRDGLRFFSPELLDKLAREAADRTTLLFDAGEAPVGELPVVLAHGIPAILLHEAMGHGFEADFNRKGISIYAERLGQKIAADFVTILDDGTNERMRGSINIDDEGTPAQATVLVEKGVLRSFLHDRISAKHYSLASTGSGRRQNFRYPPVPRMRNTYMLAGPHKPEEIIASVKKGLYAEQFSNGQVDIGAGDFTFFLKYGRLIENGKLTRVVKDANLIGSGPKVLEKIDMVADDLEMISSGGYCGKDGQRVPVGFGQPTLRAAGISIGGRKS